MTPEVPARLHVLMAREAPMGVIFRRGPSKQVACYHWDRKTDAITLGQWFKGRIYHHRCDLSPDGKHMIYFAMNGKWDSPVLGSWTAISKPPFLTALHLYPKGDCWNGGGLFTSNSTYWVNDGPWPHKMTPDFLMSSPVKREGSAPLGITGHGGEDLQLYLPRLIRDGWTVVKHDRAGHESTTLLEKPIKRGWTLQKTVHASVGTGPLGQCYWEAHIGFGPDQMLDGAEWEWADVDKGNVVFCRQGALWRIAVHAKRADEAVLIHDFNDATFEAREAPYAGLKRKWNVADQLQSDRAK